MQGKHLLKLNFSDIPDTVLEGCNHFEVVLGVLPISSINKVTARKIEGDKADEDVAVLTFVFPPQDKADREEIIQIKMETDEYDKWRTSFSHSGVGVTLMSRETQLAVKITDNKKAILEVEAYKENEPNRKFSYPIDSVGMADRLLQRRVGDLLEYDEYEYVYNRALFKIKVFGKKDDSMVLVEYEDVTSEPLDPPKFLQEAEDVIKEAGYSIAEMVKDGK